MNVKLSVVGEIQMSASRILEDIMTVRTTNNTMLAVNSATHVPVEIATSEATAMTDTIYEFTNA
jgi:hypothetical protein